MKVKRFVLGGVCMMAVLGCVHANAENKLADADVVGLRLGMSFEQVQSTLKALYPSYRFKILNKRGGGAMGLRVAVESAAPKVCSYGCPEHIELTFGLHSNKLWAIQRRVVVAEPIAPKTMTEELTKKYGVPTKLWALGFQVSMGVDGKPKEGCSGVVKASERDKGCGASFDANYSQDRPISTYSVTFANVGELWRDDEAGRAELAAGAAASNSDAIRRASGNKPSL